MSQPASSTARQIPSGVWVLGFVSMLMDISSEMIHSLLPMFMVTSLGTSVLAVGLVEGLAESTALIVKVFSGSLSDYLGKRKGLAVAGYALGAVSKPLFAMATSFGAVVTGRLLDRVGKGIRGAPRDALVADLTPKHVRGAAFGLRQSLDTVGAFVGPLIAVGLMLLWSSDFRAVFWVATIPAFLAVALLLFGLREPKRDESQPRTNPIRQESISRLPRAYWWVVAVGATSTLARFSEAFLVLRAQQTGIPPAFVPLVMVAMSMVYAASAYPFGKLADAMNHRRLLGFGLIVLLAADLVLASGMNWIALFGGVALWGIHMGMTQGLLATMVADNAPEDLRGTAYGVFNLVSGLAMLVASTFAGLIWDAFGAASTFYAGAGFCLIALFVLGRQPGQRSGHSHRGER
ncbi:MFS transporter [Variovorax sp. GT1P44]|uniref:MFS transporter n=1 Tax=Variovorax sp. GT1P44 TaxID=3443742 RepID=UPI003F4844BA